MCRARHGLPRRGLRASAALLCAQARSPSVTSANAGASRAAAAAVRLARCERARVCRSCEHPLLLINNKQVQHSLYLECVLVLAWDLPTVATATTLSSQHTPLASYGAAALWEGWGALEALHR